MIIPTEAKPCPHGSREMSKCSACYGALCRRVCGEEHTGACLGHTPGAARAAAPAPPGGERVWTPLLDYLRARNVPEVYVARAERPDNHLPFPLLRRIVRSATSDPVHTRPTPVVPAV